MLLHTSSCVARSVTTLGVVRSSSSRELSEESSYSVAYFRCAQQRLIKPESLAQANLPAKLPLSSSVRRLENVQKFSAENFRQSDAIRRLLGNIIQQLRLYSVTVAGK